MFSLRVLMISAIALFILPGLARARDFNPALFPKLTGAKYNRTRIEQLIQKRIHKLAPRSRALFELRQAGMRGLSFAALQQKTQIPAATLKTILQKEHSRVARRQTKSGQETWAVRPAEAEKWYWTKRHGESVLHMVARSSTNEKLNMMSISEKLMGQLSYTEGYDLDRKRWGNNPYYWGISYAPGRIGAVTRRLEEYGLISQRAGQHGEHLYTSAE